MVALAVCLSVGCGGTSGPRLEAVSGTVTLNGDPVPGLKIVFVPKEQGSPSYGATDASGRYQLQFSQSRAGAQRGLHHVLIENREPETDDRGVPISMTPTVRIPEKFGRPGQLSADVSAGRNRFDFELESELMQTDHRQALRSQAINN